MKANSNGKNEQIALYIPAVDTKHYNNEYRTLHPYFVRLTESGEIRGFYFESEEFEGLRFYSQWERDAATLRPYGFHLEYTDRTLRHPEQALRMLKMLRRIERIEQGFPVTPATFGQFVTLLAKGLGIKVALMPTLNGRSWDYNTTQHLRFKVGEESQRAIDRIIEDSWKLDHPEPLKQEEVSADAN